MTTLRVGRNNPKGFTLIELLVTLAVVGMIMGLVVGQVGKLLSRDMKGAASRLGSTIRYLYNKAGTEGLTLRLVFDIEEGSYWVEGTSEHFTLTKEEEAFSKKEGEEGEKKGATFSPEESYLLKPVQLPKGVFIKDVYAEHQIDRLSEGKAYIYFFPQGYVERSVINLRDNADEVHFSLQVNPISGSVKIEAEYKEPEIER